MAQIKQHRLELADVLRKHIADYQNQYPLWPEHRKIVSDLLNCRTVRLGGHIDRCNRLSLIHISEPTRQESRSRMPSSA